MAWLIYCYIDDLAALEQQLDEFKAAGTISQTERLNIFKEEVDRILSAICTLQPDYAEATFGEQAATYFYEAAELSAMGHYAQAQQLLESANHLKEAVTFCGMSIRVEEAQNQGLKVKTYAQHFENGKENWDWSKKAVCAVKACPTRPDKVKVGPCNVCRKCQKIFDKGQKPKPVYKVVSIMDQITDTMRDFNHRYEADKAKQKVAKAKRDEDLARSA
jgi:hypothetical protein